MRWPVSRFGDSRCTREGADTPWQALMHLAGMLAAPVRLRTCLQVIRQRSVDGSRGRGARSFRDYPPAPFANRAVARSRPTTGRASPLRPNTFLVATSRVQADLPTRRIADSVTPRHLLSLSWKTGRMPGGCRESRAYPWLVSASIVRTLLTRSRRGRRGARCERVAFRYKRL